MFMRALSRIVLGKKMKKECKWHTNRKNPTTECVCLTDSVQCEMGVVLLSQMDFNDASSTDFLSVWIVKTDKKNNTLVLSSIIETMILDIGRCSSQFTSNISSEPVV